MTPCYYYPDDTPYGRSGQETKSIFSNNNIVIEVVDIFVIDISNIVIEVDRKLNLFVFFFF